MSQRTIGTQTQYLTNEQIEAMTVDGILDGNLITSLFISKGKKWRGGRELKQNLKYKTSQAQGWYTGLGNFDTTQQDITVQMAWTPASLYGGVTLSGLEMSINANKPAINEKQLRMESAKDDLLNSIGTAFYGSGTGAACDGLGNIVDDGSVQATYAGLTRATYDALNSDVSTSVGSLTLDDIGASIDACTIGANTPNIIITTPTIWRAIEDLLFPSVSATYGAAGSKRGKINRLGDVGAGPSLTGLAGYTALYYRDIPIVKDEKCTAGYIYYLNQKFIFWSGLPHCKYGETNLGGGLIEGVENMKPKNHGISWTGWKTPINQDGETSQFIMYGQLQSNSPRHQAVDQGVTA